MIMQLSESTEKDIQSRIDFYFKIITKTFYGVKYPLENINSIKEEFYKKVTSEFYLMYKIPKLTARRYAKQEVDKFVNYCITIDQNKPN